MMHERFVSRYRKHRSPQRTSLSVTKASMCGLSAMRLPCRPNFDEEGAARIATNAGKSHTQALEEALDNNPGAHRHALRSGRLMGTSMHECPARASQTCVPMRSLPYEVSEKQSRCQDQQEH